MQYIIFIIIWIILSILLWYSYHAYNILYGDLIIDPPFSWCLIGLPVITIIFIADIISNKNIPNIIKDFFDKFFRS